MKKLMKKLTALLMACTMLATGIAANAATVSDFTDVKPGTWYYKAVEYAADNGLFSGTSKTTFSPDGAMTRGMFVKVLANKAGIDESKYLRYRFTDVPQGIWYATAVEWAATYSIVSGTSKTTFSPNKPITREQMAVILYNYAKKTGNDSTFTTAAFDSFKDKDKVSGWAKEAMQWATSHNVIAGSGGKLNPQGTATRSQVAQVFLNCKDILVKTEITDTPTPAPEEPKIELTPEQRAQLTKDQDPDEVLRQVLAGTDAKWDASLSADNAYILGNLMFFGATPDGKYTTEDTTYWAKKYIFATGADKFRFVVTEDLNSSYEGLPGRGIDMYYTIPEREDSEMMKAVRAIVEKEYPNAVWKVMGGGHGWYGGGSFYSAETYMEELGYTFQQAAQKIADACMYEFESWGLEKTDTFTYWMSQDAQDNSFYFWS